MDGTSTVRCMTVGLSDDQQHACRLSIMPVELVRFRTAAEACKAMSTVLPLIVAVDEHVTEQERADLAELAEACGAELALVATEPVLSTFAPVLIAALGRAERRRFKVVVA